MLKKFRLALRVEGPFWVAYLADIDSMKGATIIGSIAMSAACDPTVKTTFISTMKMALEAVSPRPVKFWNEPVEARKSERSGNA
jgi:hypothetical protein